MKINCNNCSREISFQNDQRFVDCLHCYTHFKIETSGEKTTLKIIEPENEEDKSFVLDQRLLELSFLEKRYIRYSIKHWFPLIPKGKLFKPTLIYAFAKLLIGISGGWMSLDSLSKVENSYYFSIRIIGILVGVFLIVKAYEEVVKWILMGKFEQNYFDEKDTLMKLIEPMNLPDTLQQSFITYQQVYEEYKNIQTNKTIKIKEYLLKLDNQIVFVLFAIFFMGNTLLSNRFGSINLFIVNIIIVCLGIVGFKLFQKQSEIAIIDTYPNQIQPFVKALNDYIKYITNSKYV